MEELHAIIARIDERTKNIQKTLENTADILNDHEGRIRHNEGMVQKVAVLFSFIGIAITAGITAIWKKIIH